MKFYRNGPLSPPHWATGFFCKISGARNIKILHRSPPGACRPRVTDPWRSINAVCTPPGPCVSKWLYRTKASRNRIDVVRLGHAIKIIYMLLYMFVWIDRIHLSIYYWLLEWTFDDGLLDTKSPRHGSQQWSMHSRKVTFYFSKLTSCHLHSPDFTTSMSISNETHGCIRNLGETCLHFIFVLDTFSYIKEKGCV